MSGNPSAARQDGLSAPGRSPARRHGDRDDVVVLPGRGLRLPQQLPFDRWLTVGPQLAEIYTSSAWCLGDWLAYGEAAYTSPILAGKGWVIA